MGAFYLIRNGSEIKESAVLELFQQKGLREPSVFPLSGYKICIYNKILPSGRNYILRDDSSLFAIGSFCYRGKSYEGSLLGILNDLLSGQFSFEEVQGSFCFVASIRNEILLITDRSGIQNLYYDRRCNLLSSSFLAVMVGLSGGIHLNRMALLETVATGIMVGPETVADEILRLDWRDSKSFAFKPIQILRPPDELDAVRSTQSSFNAQIENQIERLNAYFERLKPIIAETGVDTGLSGGFDSRLLFALIRNTFPKHSAHSHYKNPPDTDLRIAREIAAQSSITLRTVLVNPPWTLDREAAERALEGAYYFYDGHIRVNYPWLTEFRTIRYRRELLGEVKTGMNGIGGEQFRNRDRIVSNYNSVRNWIRNTMIGSPYRSYFASARAEEALFDQIRRGLARRLGIKGSNIDFLGIKRWWNEVWIPFGPGIRNNAENQLSLFFSPFADPLLSLPAYGNISHLGPSVRFEAEMIRRIAPDLARIHSSYGYSFDRIPATDRWFSYVRYGLKRPQTILRQLSPRHHPALLQGKPDGSQDYATLVGELLREAYSLELPINRKFLDTAEPCFYRMVDLGYFVRQNRQRIVGIT